MYGVIILINSMDVVRGKTKEANYILIIIIRVPQSTARHRSLRCLRL